MTDSMFPYLSDKIPKPVFHGQAVRNRLPILRISTAQQDFPIEPVNPAVLGEPVQQCGRQGGVPEHNGPLGKR